MLTFLCLVAGVISAFMHIGATIHYFDAGTSRASFIFSLVVLDLLSVVLAAIFMPAIVPYLFIFAFTRAIIYGISDIENILYITITE